MPLYDVDDLMNAVENDAEHLEGDTPVIGCISDGSAETFLDLLGFEYSEETNVLYLNLGPRR